MKLENLNSKDKETIRECLRASAEGPFFGDDDFETIFGVTRQELKEVLKLWPSVDDGDEQVKSAVYNSLNNLLGYPHGKEAAWGRFISVPASEVERVLEKLAGK